MKKKLIVGLMLLGLGYAASQVMSQSPPTNSRLPAKPNEKRDAAAIRESFNDEIHRLRDKLADILKSQEDPLPQDVALLKSLDKYIASNKLSKIIMDLEEFAKQSPQTDEAKKAIAAIQVLKAEAVNDLIPIPDANNFRSGSTFERSGSTFEEVQPRNRTREDPFDSNR